MKHKNLTLTLIYIVTATLIAAICALVVFVCYNMGVAFAAQEKQVIKAGVSNLEGNEFAGASAIQVYENDGDRTFLIPESYYVEYVRDVAGGLVYCSVRYMGEDFYMDVSFKTYLVSETFSDDEALSPDVSLAIKEGVRFADLDSVMDKLKKVDSTYDIKLLGYDSVEGSSDVYILATSPDGDRVFGFVPADAFEPFNVPYQQKAQAERDALLAQKEQLDPPAGSGSLPVPEGSTALKIILILGISVPAVLIVILLFVPSRHGNTVRKTRGASSDGMDYDMPGDAPTGRYTSDRRQYDRSRSYSDPYDPRDPRYNNGYGNNGGNGYGGNGYNSGNGNGYGGNDYNSPDHYDDRR